MYLRSLVLALGAVSAVSATENCVGVCNADNCLRALRATQIATRLPQASADCTRIIDVTYTPPTVTKTEYSAVTQTDISTIPSTLVKSFFDTQTDVVEVTVTTSIITTITKAANNKRADTSTSISFPTYATPCSGFYRFSSACSCIGVTPRIITVAAPSTTITLPVTETSLTSVTSVVDTTSVTITEATVSVTTTVTTVTSTIATTVEAADIIATPRVYIGNTPQTTYIGLIVGTESTQTYVTPWTGAKTLRLGANGWLWANDRVAVRDLNINYAGNRAQLVFMNPASLPATRQPYICALDADSFLTCGIEDPLIELVFSYQGSTNLVWLSKAANSGAPTLATNFKMKFL
ncbi:hypothetical protein TWF481_008265 [Arthrobotrys musiformis]|uniref:Uncharacterized protein n=1 Tax=Arthrobotrys musiformis TaxID=47236 RepID=A0AAV9W7K7_9PEZI